MSPEHIAHPYPTEQEKAQIMKDTGIELKQLTNWFVNNRKRYWKPRVEARMQQQQAQQQAQQQHVHQAATAHVVTPNPTMMRTIAVGPGPAPSAPVLTLDMTQPAGGQTAGHHTLEPTRHVSVVTTSGLPVTMAQALAAPGQILSVVTTTTPMMAPAPAPTPIAIVSEASSAGSTTTASDSSEGGMSSGEDDQSPTDTYEPASGMITRTETLAVHILRPTGGSRDPTIEDVTVLPNVPTSRILCTFRNCSLNYSFHSDISKDRKKVQSRRDGEVVRIKKQYLKVYLAREAETVGLLTSRLASAPSPIKRKVSEDPETEAKRIKFDGQSPTMWRSACSEAKYGYCDSLPTMEEAALLFGFATNNKQ